MPRAGQDTEDGGSAVSEEAAETVIDSDAAAVKDETVYVMTAADGIVQKIYW